MFDQDPSEHSQISGADFAAMCDEMKKLKSALSAVKERSGREMDYGSSDSAIQAIYAIATEALK